MHADNGVWRGRVEEDEKRSNSKEPVASHSERTKGMPSTKPRSVFLLLKQANVLMGIQPEGIIQADLLLRKLGVRAQKNLAVSFFGAAAPYDQPIVDTISAERSNVFF